MFRDVSLEKTESTHNICLDGW